MINTPISYSIVMSDYPIMSMLDKTTMLPKPLVSGQSATYQNQVTVSSYPGPNFPVFVNHVV